MNAECSIALDALSLTYMLVLIVSLMFRRRRDLLNRQYSRLTVTICVFLLLDIVYMSLYGGTGALGRAALKLAKSLYFVVNSAIVWLWAGYIDRVLFGDRYAEQKHRVFYHAVFLVNTGIVLADLFTDILFRISPEGTFLVGAPGMWLFTILNYLSLIAAELVLFRNRRLVELGNFIPLMLFPLPPLCVELVQIFYRPFSLISAYAVSALLVFQVSQNSTIYTDGLTGLANRRMLDDTLEKWLSDLRGTGLCGIMADLDGLKQINDTYGHVSGDNALIALAQVLRSVKHKRQITARYGGDEFILAWRAGEERELEEAERVLEEARRQLNSLRPPREQISFSIGCFYCRDGDGLTAEEFLRRLDGQMYRRKQARRQSGPEGRLPES